MLVELLQAETSDGLLLDGALSLPAPGTAAALNLDVVLCLHGVGGNFYGGRLFSSLAPAFLSRGVAVARVNTRGHGLVNAITTRRGSARQGAALEIVDHCRHDIAAWTTRLVERGLPRIGLLGHSLGAIKAVYAQAEQPSEHVACVLAASPPRLSYQKFLAGNQREAFLQAISQAQAMLDAEQPDALLTTTFPVPLLISAASYVDKYGPGERYDILRYLARVDRPALFTYGERELASGSSAFDQLPAEIERIVPAQADTEVVVIPGADHFYTGLHDQLAAVLIGWLEQRFGVSA